MLDWNKYPAVAEFSAPRGRDSRDSSEIDSRDLASLAPSAIPVFALRCARRAVPLITGVDSSCKAAVASCISFAERKARGMSPRVPDKAIRTLCGYLDLDADLAISDASRFAISGSGGGSGLREV